MCSLYLCLGEATTVKWSYRGNFREDSEPLWHFSGSPVSQGVVLPSKEVTVRGGWYFPPLFLLLCNLNSTHCLLWSILQGWNQGVGIFSWNGCLVFKVFSWSGHVSGFLSAPFYVFFRAPMGGQCSYLWFAAGETEAELGCRLWDKWLNQALMPAGTF